MLRILSSVVVAGFVVRYIILARRVETQRIRDIETATETRVRPWRDWAEWRRHIIESEFMTNGA